MGSDARPFRIDQLEGEPGILLDQQNQQAALDVRTGNDFDINPPGVLFKRAAVGGPCLPLYRVFHDRIESRSALRCGPQ